MRHGIATVLALELSLLGCSDGDSAPASAPSASSASQASAGGSGASGAGGSATAGGSGGTGGAACAPNLPLADELPEALSETGLYASIADKEIAADVEPFAPRYLLWSDGADKQRWIHLPDCPIDTSDMNHWSLPVGVRLYKEFSIGGERIETRLIERIGPGAHDFLFAAYLWNDDETEAHRVPDGVVDAKDTGHDVPGEAICRHCHGSHPMGGGLPSRALGFSALQLSHDGEGLTLDALVQSGRLSDPPAATPAVPGDPIEQAALGYLHANCGNCHNDSADGIAQVDMSFWLPVDAASVTTTPSYLTTVGQPNSIFNDPHVTARIEPGDPAKSAVFYRMSQRGDSAQMPPVASEVVDADGLAAVEAWIVSLP